MNCKNVHQYLFFYADESLQDTLLQEVENHLHTCEECTFIVHQMKLGLSSITNKSTNNEDLFYYSRLKIKLNSSNNKNKTLEFIRPIYLRVAVLLFFVISGICLGLFLGNITNEENLTAEKVNTTIEKSMKLNYTTNIDEELSEEIGSIERMEE